MCLWSSVLLFQFFLYIYRFQSLHFMLKVGEGFLFAAVNFGVGRQCCVTWFLQERKLNEAPKSIKISLEKKKNLPWQHKVAIQSGRGSLGAQQCYAVSIKRFLFPYRCVFLWEFVLLSLLGQWKVGSCHELLLSYLQQTDRQTDSLRGWTSRKKTILFQTHRRVNMRAG